jgi:hypothetical protein
MHKPNYAGVLAATTPEDQVRALKASGYATDPRYVSKLLAVRGQVAGIAGSLLNSTYDPLSGQLVQTGQMPGGLDAVGQNPEITDLIKRVQTQLKDAGLYNGEIDGISGPQTKAAAKAYFAGESAGRIADVANVSSNVIPASMATEAPPAVQEPPSPSDQFENVVGWMPQFAQPYAMPDDVSGGSGGDLVAGNAGGIPPNPMIRPIPVSGGAGGDLIAGNATALPLNPPARPTIASAPPVSGGGGNDFSGRIDTLPETISGGSGGDIGRSVPDLLEPASVAGGGGGNLAAGNASALPANPRPRPSIATAAPVMDGRVKDDAYTPPPPTAATAETTPEPEPQIPGTLFAAPGDTMAASVPETPDPVQVAMSPPPYSATTMAMAPPPVSEPEVSPAPTMVSAPPPAQTHRPVTPAQTAPAPTTMASAPPPSGGWIDKVAASILGRNTNGSRGFTGTGSGVNPVTGQPYRSGTGIGGQSGLQWTNSHGQTVTVQENTFGQPGYLTGFG